MKKITYYKASYESYNISLSEKFRDRCFESKKRAIEHLEELLPEFFKAYPTLSLVKEYKHESAIGYIHQIVVIGNQSSLKMITLHVKELILILSD